ncbi:T9SS type A sorting domain-containing protein [Polaribacter sp. SA4-12]|uniref:T9SS type A sorting domain-containing protein n=1 Tax=Polaribacter sp. SA4-12 TaxID=1312072 RepID=UPI000B3D348E|nr:T9SS type A sorting domain-containing protein [Polaribacter sp. SA4-12]ARV16604.1 hypothetical protein BTO07_16325 [Polaribacter sp. SA4-12]
MMKKITLLLFSLTFGVMFSQCPAPVITIGDITDNSIAGTFTPPEGEADYAYAEVRYYPTASPASPGSWGGTNASFNISGLLPGTEYTINIRYNCGGAMETLGTTATTTGDALTTTDSYTFTNDPTAIVQGPSFGLEITYTSEDNPIAIGAISLQLHSNVDGDAVIGIYTNTEELPMGVDQTATIILGNTFPEAYLTTGENLLASTIVSGDSTPGASVGSELAIAYPGLANYFYFVKPLTTSEDPNWTPLSIPATKYFQVEVDPNLSTEDFKFNSVKLFPNPTTGLIKISGLEDAKFISIHNVIGQEVKRFTKLNSTIDISELNKGIYILKSDNGLTRKIIKK